MLSFIRRRRVFAKLVLWVLIGVISIGLIAWYGIGMIPQSTSQQPNAATSQTQQ